MRVLALSKGSASGAPRSSDQSDWDRFAFLAFRLGELAVSLGLVIRPHLCRRPVVQAAVRPGRVVRPAVLLDHDLRLRTAGEPLAVEAFVPEPTVEALDHPVLPRLARIDQSRLDPVERLIATGPSVRLRDT